LGKLGPAAKGAVPDLIKLMMSVQDRDAARAAVREIDAVDASAVPILIEALESEERFTRFIAIFLLKKLGPQAKDALPALKKLTTGESRRLRESVEETIRAIEAQPEDKAKDEGEPKEKAD
jgi:HEAT repeat protein